MKSFKILISSIACFHFQKFSHVSSQGYDYSQNGADWRINYPACGENGQSPIDLRNYMHSNPFPTVRIQNEFQKNYRDIQNQQVYWWTNNTIKVFVEDKDEKQKTQYFNSLYASTSKNFNADTQFNANQFHFHADSEHTINGQRFDFEMHVVHFPNKVQNGIVASAVGMIFDTKNYNKSVTQEQIDLIDKFFDSLQLDKQNDPISANIPFGQLMATVNTNQRWIYKGSLTIPPCTKTVMFNVLSTVYPIKERHLKLFRQQLARNGLEKTGNWRQVQPINDQDVHYLMDYEPLDPHSNSVQITLMILTVCVVLLIALVVTFILKQNEVQSQVQEEEITTENQKIKETENEDSIEIV